jgi:uncharacterized protein (TIGR02117 family)
MLTAAWALFLLATIGGCCGPIEGLYPPQAGDARDVYLVNNHWHTGFVFPTSELTPTLRQLLPRFADAEYLEIGWGDDRFYRSPKSTIGLATAALFASQGSVLHVVPLSRPPQEHYQDFIADLYRIRVSDAGYQRLMAFVEKTFSRDDSGKAVESEAEWGPGSWFYRGNGHYSLFHTCNQWTADALRTTGFPISPAYAGGADNVGWQIRTFGGKYQSDLRVLQDGKPVATAPAQKEVAVAAPAEAK